MTYYNFVYSKDKRKPAIPTESWETQVTLDCNVIDLWSSASMRDKKGEHLRESTGTKSKNRSSHSPTYGTKKNDLPSRETRPQGNKNGGWTKVVNKRKKKKPKVQVVSSKENLSSAKILKTIEADPNLRGLGQNVSEIRRT